VVLKKRTEERLGEILLRQGKISKNQLQQALELQSEKGGLLGEVLISMGHVKEEGIAQALVSQYGFPFIPLDNVDFNPEAARIFPENLARKYLAAPMDIIGDVLVLAMSNPLNISAIKEIEMFTEKKAQTFIAVITSINEAINKIYKKT